MDWVFWGLLAAWILLNHWAERRVTMTKAREVNNSMDIVDSRDIKARLDELTELRADLLQEVNDLIYRTAELCNQGDATNWDLETAKLAIGGYLEDLADKTLSEEEVKLNDEAESINDKLGDCWVTKSGSELAYSPEYGEDEEQEFQALKAIEDELPDEEGLIRDSYFETYARDLAEDLGFISSDAQWPATCIDWEKAADELKMDYSSLEWDGVTYWFRS